MKHKCKIWFGALMLGVVAFGGEPKFEKHSIPCDLPVRGDVGDYGQSALVDLDNDGKLDFVLGQKGGKLYWFGYEGADKWTQHVVGERTQSDVGLAALDVDGDGWVDLVCSGVWFRNPGKAGGAWERYVYDERNVGAHDVLAVDVDGDGRKDIVTMYGGPNANMRMKEGLRWYKIPTDAKGPWERHIIGEGVHGAITPGGAGDIAGNKHMDIVCADTWYENVGGKGREWVAHKNIPMGRVGPFGMCVRCAVVDMDGDGKPEIVMLDADIVGCKGVVLKNADGKGGGWEKHDLPQSFVYGSSHALGVADFDGDGRPDIATVEQEELLPNGRQNPRFVVWENLGGLNFKEHIILDEKLGGHELQVGDVDGDGRIDICSKPWGPRAWNAAGGKMHVEFLRNVSGNEKK